MPPHPRTRGVIVPRPNRGRPIDLRAGHPSKKLHGPMASDQPVSAMGSHPLKKKIRGSTKES